MKLTVHPYNRSDSFVINRLDGTQLGKVLMHFIHSGGYIRMEYECPCRRTITDPIRKAAAKYRGAIKAEQEGRCAICNCKHKLTIDHIIAIKDGGDSARTNLRGVCWTCHLSLHNRNSKPCSGHRIETPVATSMTTNTPCNPLEGA